MARTHLRAKYRLLALAVALAFFGTACSANPRTHVSAEAEAALADELAQEAAAAELKASDATDRGAEPDSDGFAGNEPDALAFAEDVGPSPEFCTASANIWVHSAALNLIGDDANPEMTQIALLNLAEWLERSTLFAEDGARSRTEMFEAFQDLSELVAVDFASDWQAMQASTAFANHPGGQVFEAERRALVRFINDECDEVTIADLAADAEARANELVADYRTAESTVAESESFPGQSIFTHSSGRLLVAFPTDWPYEDVVDTPTIAEFVASRDLEKFVAGDLIDAMRLQLVNAPTLDEFRQLIGATDTAVECTVANELSDSGTSRVNITQTLECPGHGATIVGQYSEDRGLGVILEMVFDRESPTRADIMRVTSISSSILWS